ncbi:MULTISPECIES: gamma carbonic anhydrase family protein [unclassified Corynebacterium]|uniref:gamma carbonic anhydrase family protein n=1 Tax=unclassified Corynebacterium TaxID=2624378 RepID=UPI0008A49210|nr:MULTISPECIES: gamma carbonic anhydrase family protein [unclassified Corynebacterium]OFP36999.1 gamma carbonic anhydrase family protein [Corynebacterium sp. HMSC071B10]OHF40402.1 gamma carbonic anhydrase family protein [Corynebacterium sp. HMSC074A01]
MAGIYAFEGKAPQIHPSAYIAPGATVIGDVTIGEDVNIWPGAVLRGDVGAIVIGARCNVQDGAVIHVETGHTTVLEEDVTVGHLALVHGCHVESACLIGMSSTVLSGARVGEGSIVGGGGVVLEGQEIPPFSVAAGVPAKVRKSLDPATREQRVKHAAGYVELARRHREGLAEYEV